MFGNVHFGMRRIGTVCADSAPNRLCTVSRSILISRFCLKYIVAKIIVAILISLSVCCRIAYLSGLIPKRKMSVGINRQVEDHFSEFCSVPVSAGC